MTVPSWGVGVCHNYRAMYKEKYGTDTKLTDEVIWEIFNTVFNDEDNKQQDVERVEAMRAAEAVL